jgi:hypothetical protein
VEAYLAEHMNTRFSHSICPACYASMIEPQFDKTRNNRQ